MNRPSTRQAVSADGFERRRGLALSALMLAVAPALIDVTIVATALPRIVADLGGFAYSSWLFAGYLLAMAVSMPLYGSLADLFGRKPVLVWGTLLFLVGSLSGALAWNMASLIASRVVQGLGAGAIQGTAQTLAGDLYEPAERGRAQAGFSAVGMSASLAGPLVGGLLTMYMSWRGIFLINLPLCGAALLLGRRYIHDTHGLTARDPAAADPDPAPAPAESAAAVPAGWRGIDWTGALGLFTAAGLLLFFLEQGGTAWPWLSPPSIGTLAAVVVCTAATVWIERRSARPIVPSWVWRRRVMLAGNITLGAFGMMVTAPALILPTYAQAVLGLNPLCAGLILAAVMVSWPAAAVISNQVYMRIGFRNTALAGAALATLALLAMMLLAHWPVLWPVVLSLLVLGIAFGFLQPPIIVGVQSTVLWRERGTATSSILFCRQIGQSAGAALYGAVANGVLASWLAAAPAALKPELPRTLDKIATELRAGGALSPPAASYLRHAIATVTDHDFALAGAAGTVALLALLVIAPRRFTTADPAHGQADLRRPGKTAGQAT